MCEIELHVNLGGKKPLWELLSTRHYSPRRGTIFHVQVVHRRMALLRGRDFEESQDVALINIFLKYIRTSQF